MAAISLPAHPVNNKTNTRYPTQLLEGHRNSLLKGLAFIFFWFGIPPLLLITLSSVFLETFHFLFSIAPNRVYVLSLGFTMASEGDILSVRRTPEIIKETGFSFG
jgi:hypothetical protein